MSGAKTRAKLTPDLCVIGAGAGGLAVAAGAVQMGASVVLVERGEMGGDCLNVGCVPSKALLAAARRAQSMRTSRPFGIVPVTPQIDPRAVSDHIAGVINAIAPNDSVERFTGLGVQVVQGTARFKDPRTVVVGDREVAARTFVIATGSSPAIPPIEGINRTPFFTNETIFANRRRIEHLIIIGGGPIGLELAQAHLRLGSAVTVIEAMKAMGKDDPELSEVVLKRLRAEGVQILEGVRVDRVERTQKGVKVTISGMGEAMAIEGSELLVAAGRKPNVEDLNLEAANVKYDARGIKVGRGLLTSNRRIYAIGDVIGGLQFTHVANYHAGIVVKRAVFRLPVAANEAMIPWVTYTDPELAQVGLTEDKARERHGKVGVLRWSFHENDRAQAERASEGFVKVIVTRGGKILGASIVGEHAGELIQTWSLAISQGLNIKAMTDFVVPYPTLAEVNKRAAYTFFLPKLASPLVRKTVQLLARLG
jgi:pyruvate/2-oxoglutarate dehydrogenase complex dihydrolipoamide dehydrogenase (E3) component